MKKKNVNHWRNNLLLLLSVVFLFIVGPTINKVSENPFIISIFFTLLVISGIFAAEYTKIVFKILSLLGGIAVFFIWIEFFVSNALFNMLTSISISLVLVSITGALIAHVASHKHVNADILFSAINAYLLIGIVGALVFRVILFSNPNALTITVEKGEGFEQLVYFSYVTLSTLGYGEITPISPGAKAVSMILSLTGPLYLAIIIAFLVGKIQSQNNNNK